MDFASVVLFLVLYYLRPQEWFSALSLLRPAKLVLIMALYSLVKREKKLSARDFFLTPHDWLVTAYFVWTIFATSAHMHTLQTIQSQIVTYYVVVQALSISTVDRTKRLVGWWSAMLIFISVMAIVSEYGFDPLESYDITHGPMKGRLVLNLSIFNNPNALAHALVPVIPMLFFLLFWKKTVSKAMIALLGVPLWCIFMTESKGAFLCAFVTVLATFTFGRPKIVQALIVVLAAGFGYAALYTLPRMSELNKSKSDAAIQGRVAAYTFGLECMRTYFYGIGFGNFQDEFFKHGPLEYPEHAPHRVIRVGGRDVVQILPKVGHHYSKATHGVYNQNGAELGRTGLFLFVGILYSCFRTIVTAKTANTEEERVRRILFSIVLSFAVSSWMVDFMYRPTFFVMVAATAAFHRHLRRGLDELPEEAAETDAIPAWRARLHPVPALAQPMPALAMAGAAPMSGLPAPSRPASLGAGAMDPDSDEETSEDGEPAPVMEWKKLGLVDLGIIAVANWVVIRYWIHLIHTM